VLVGARVPVLVAAAVGCVLAPPLALAGVHSPLRVVAALLLFGVAPGAAMMGLLKPRAMHAELALVVALSLGISALAGELLLELGAWSPHAAACALAAVCLPPIAFQLVAARRSRAHAGS
jgi:hypothetical protein